MKFELTEPADRDIADILRQTRQLFGARQVVAYSRIIEHGIALVADDPMRPGSRARPEIAEGVRFIHLEVAAGRRGGAAHCLYYKSGTLSDASSGIVVLRVLHERMEPRSRILPALPD